MNRHMIDIPMKQGVCDAYVSYPQLKENVPALILYMDAVGLRRRIFDMADRFAAEGFFVVAPNTYYRTKRAPIIDYDTYLAPDMIAELFKQVMPIAKSLTTDMGKQDAGDLVRFLQNQPQVDPEKIGCVGYCMGGGHALRTAGNYSQIKAAASFHAGNLAWESESSPHHWFSTIKGRVYIGHADNDKSMPPEQQIKVDEELKASGIRHKAELYNACLHGWTMQDLPAYNSEGETKHWQRALEFFNESFKL